MRKKTHQEFIEEMKNINSDFQILTKYETGKTKVKVKCNRCGNIWMATPENLLQGKGCKKCRDIAMRNARIKPKWKFVEQMTQINPDIEIIGDYAGRTDKIECRCKIHNETFFITPRDLLRGHTGCQQCIKNKLHSIGLKTDKQFKEEVAIKNSNLEVLGTYDGANKRILVKCKRCGRTWNPIAYSILRGVGCTCQKSKGEEDIKRFFDSNNIVYEEQKKFDDLRGKRNIPLSYDFYVPKNNLLIEFQGCFHDGTAKFVRKELYYEKQKINDSKKREYAKNNGFIFLEIWYYERNKIPDILSDVLNIKNRVTTTGMQETA